MMRTKSYITIEPLEIVKVGEELVDDIEQKAANILGSEPEDRMLLMTSIQSAII